MTEDEIYRTLTGVFREVFENDSLVARPEMSAKDVPEWDSFNHINILVASEMKFGVRFTTAEVEGLHTVGDFVRLIQKKL